MPVRETLFLRLRDLASQGMVTCVTAVGESASGVTARKVPAEQLPALAASRRVVVFAPAADVRLSKVSPPVRQASKALQAAPYLLEEQLAEDVEELHFALGPRQDDGSFPAAVVATAQLDEWLQQIKLRGIEPHALVPEMLALPPPTAEVWSALTDGEQIIVRNAPWNGFVADEQNLEVMLQVADGTGEAHALQLFVMKNDARDFTRLQRRVELRPGHAYPLEAYARHYRADDSINLLQGSHARRESWRRYWQPWRLAAGLAAACFVGGVALNGVLAWKLGRAAAAQEAANQQRFTQLFPTERPSPYLAAQIEGLVRRARGGGADSLFFLLQNFAQAQSATPGLTLKGLQFHDGALYLDLTGSDLQVLEHLRSWFNAHPGTHLEVPTADSTAGGVQIRLKLTPA